MRPSPSPFSPRVTPGDLPGSDRRQPPADRAPVAGKPQPTDKAGAECRPPRRRSLNEAAHKLGR